MRLVRWIKQKVGKGAALANMKWMKDANNPNGEVINLVRSAVQYSPLDDSPIIVTFEGRVAKLVIEPGQVDAQFPATSALPTQ